MCEFKLFYFLTAEGTLGVGGVEVCVKPLRPPEISRTLHLFSYTNSIKGGVQGGSGGAAHHRALALPHGHAPLPHPTPLSPPSQYIQLTALEIG